MTTIQHNGETWNRSTSNGLTRRRILLNRFYLPRIFPNGYRYTPFVVAHKNTAAGEEIRVGTEHGNAPPTEKPYRVLDKDGNTFSSKSPHH